ncbi:protein BIG GRAIN 1-like B [Lycium barbarum]|uniref:protein BIG GRAIN 1-like B n=1 Tax=Lycium barbarum TaxID=112863 RepID=UPI00293E76A8|nr:protein BIG GRAIN 1-like B [Lycium barbarum]
MNMDKYKYPKEYSCSPSFSSALLDSIYHSIDQGQEKKSRNLHSSSSNIGSSCYGLSNRPKPIRTSTSTNQEKIHKHQHPKDNLNFYDYSLAKEKAKHDEDGFVKTKSRALKIYRDLKKVKQPISPGGRLSSFLNSLFTNGKKTNTSSNFGGYDNEERKLKSANASTCSSTSLFSRSCLNKNIIITPCGHKTLDVDQQNVEVVKSITRNYIHEDQLKLKKNVQVFDDNNEEEEYEDEDASCASSDLFELDNFSSIGLMELPVYETANLDTNRAINANSNLLL